MRACLEFVQQHEARLLERAIALDMNTFFKQDKQQATQFVEWAGQTDDLSTRLTFDYGPDSTRRPEYPFQCMFADCMVIACMVIDSCSLKLKQAGSSELLLYPDWLPAAKSTRTLVLDQCHFRLEPAVEVAPEPEKRHRTGNSGEAAMKKQQSGRQEQEEERATNPNPKPQPHPFGGASAEEDKDWLPPAQPPVTFGGISAEEGSSSSDEDWLPPTQPPVKSKKKRRGADSSGEPARKEIRIAADGGEADEKETNKKKAKQTEADLTP
eukprot:g63335.t1